MGVEIACRCGVRLHFSHAGWARRCPHCGEDLSSIVRDPPVDGQPIADGDPTVRIGGNGAEADGHDLPDEGTARSLEHFDLIRLLGQGGMGFVHLAYDTSLDRRVAIKTLSPELARDRSILSRFYNEARAGARVHHPNVVSIYYVGCAGGCPFFAMEYIEGTTLGERLDRDGALDPVAALEVVIAAARGLSAAHRKGIVHRDVKPSNLLVAGDGTIKIVDFGLAKSLAIDSDLSNPGTILGTPAYMSPEQVSGKPVDLRSDIYSLGVTFFHLLTGRRPFDDRTPVRVLSAHLEREPQPVEDLAPDCPPRIARVVRRMMEKDPANRFQTYDDLLEALEACRPRPRLGAGVWSRAWAFGLDFAILCGVGFSTLLLVLLSMHLLGHPLGLERSLQLFGAGERTGWDAGAASIESLQLLIVVVYFGVAHAAFGTTLGKRLLGLDVLDRWGERPGWGRSFARAAVVALTFADLDLLLGTGYALVWTVPVLLLASLVGVVWKKKALHDLVGGTQVVFRR